MKTERKQSRREKVPEKKPGFNGAERPSSPDLRASGRPSSWGSCNPKLNPELLNVFRPALCISPGRVADRKAGSVYCGGRKIKGTSGIPDAPLIGKISEVAQTF